MVKKNKNDKYILKHFIGPAGQHDAKKMESFSNVLISVAADMGLSAYEDEIHHLVGSDY